MDVLPSPVLNSKFNIDCHQAAARAEAKAVAKATKATKVAVLAPPPLHVVQDNAILRSLLALGSASSGRLFESVRTAFASRHVFGKVVRGLVQRKHVVTQETVVDKKKVFEFRVRNEAKVRKTLERRERSSKSGVVVPVAPSQS
jgi:hypothetical protein